MISKCRQRRLDLGICVRCGESPHRANLQTCVDCGRHQAALTRAHNVNRPIKRRALKLETIEHYGGDCACCRINNANFLTIDHLSGLGNQHRLQLRTRGGVNFYAWLKSQDFPSGYRVLCFNCNCAIGLYGWCPHQQPPVGILDAPIPCGTSYAAAMKRRRFMAGKCTMCNLNPFRPGAYTCLDCAMKSKIQALVKYGDLSCACCGESTLAFLTLDHIECGGQRHRKSLKKAKGGTHFYGWLKKNNYPEGYRILCFNCNCAIGAFGECPHVTK